jgi:8-oxo-dGTP pyrophosphatase MutT (NUDIX family)
MLDLVESGDPWSRDQPLHVTGSALVVHPDSQRVLLRWHVRMRKWLQVGGHADPGEDDPWDVAWREAVEETGLSELTGLRSDMGRRPVQVVIVPVPAFGDEPAHEHADVRYVLATTRPDEIASESLDAPLRWMTFADAQALVDEENLHEALRRVERALASVKEYDGCHD